MKKDIFEKIRKEKRRNLTEFEARKILHHYKIPLVKGELTRSLKEATEFCNKNGYPVALKVVSPMIPHKTDVGGVVLDVKTEKELRESYYQIIKNVERKKPSAEIDGIFVQEMLKGGYEVIVGGKYDQTFEQVILFGLGGIFVEVFDDVSFRVVPISKKDARQMIEEVKAYKLLKGYRGKKPADIQALVDILLKTSKMLEENPEIKELDINPVFALPHKAVAVDARIIID